MSDFESRLLSDLDDLSLMIDELMEMDVPNLHNIGWGSIESLGKNI